MKENKKNLYTTGYTLMRTNPLSVNTMREYWKGSPGGALPRLRGGSKNRFFPTLGY